MPDFGLTSVSRACVRGFWFSSDWIKIGLAQIDFNFSWVVLLGWKSGKKPNWLIFPLPSPLKFNPITVCILLFDKEALWHLMDKRQLVGFNA